MSRQVWTIVFVRKRFQLLGCKTQSFQEDDNKEFRLVQNLTMGEADFNQFMRLRNRLVIAAENFATEENLSPLLIPTMSRDTDQQLKPNWLTRWLM